MNAAQKVVVIILSMTAAQMHCCTVFMLMIFSLRVRCIAR